MLGTGHMERDGGGGVGGVGRGHRARLSFPRAWLPRVRNPASAPSYGEPARAGAHARPGQFALAAPGFFARQTRARMTEGPSATRHFGYAAPGITTSVQPLTYG